MPHNRISELTADNSSELADYQPNGRNWVIVFNGPPLECRFLMQLMFKIAYGRSAAPHGCSACYKVKVAPGSLRELVAAWRIAKRVECTSKWGIDFFNPYSQDVYAGYFYTSGLDAARRLLKVVREAFDADPNLGPGIPITIKRGCSEYEIALGPLDRFDFKPEMAEVEDYLKSRFRWPQRAGRGDAVLAHWIDVAFRMGDDTYLDFTDGKRLRPRTTTYDV